MAHFLTFKSSINIIIFVIFHENCITIAVAIINYIRDFVLYASLQVDTTLLFGIEYPDEHARWIVYKLHDGRLGNFRVLFPPRTRLRVVFSLFLPAGSHFLYEKKRDQSRSLSSVQSKNGALNLFLSLLQVLSALDILQPPHLDFFQEMYPFLNARTRGHAEDKSQHRDFRTGEFSYRRSRYFRGFLSLSLSFFILSLPAETSLSRFPSLRTTIATDAIIFPK